MWLFVAFLAVPLIEIALFIQLGGLIGLWPTLGIVILTAVIGTWLVRTQGAMALGQLRTSFSRLDDPSEHLAHGAMILVAGALLLTPGFFTDAVGFALLMPPVRKSLFVYLSAKVSVQKFEMGGDVSSATSEQNSSSTADVIEGEFQEIDQPKKPTHGNSGWTKH